jgi:hypothetical protein
MVGATIVSVLIAHKLYNWSGNSICSRIAQVAGFALAIGAGVATVGAVGAACGMTGGCAVLAYMAGGTVTAGTLML